MLARYKLCRGSRPTSDPLPKGIRQDVRWRCTRHPLHPERAMVQEFLGAPSEAAWRKLRKAYLDLLKRRFREDRAPFDKLAELAKAKDVFIGCSCPTKANPRIDRCHTYLALEFMKGKYPSLTVKFPLV